MPEIPPPAPREDEKYMAQNLIQYPTISYQTDLFWSDLPLIAEKDKAFICAGLLTFRILVYLV